MGVVLKSLVIVVALSIGLTIRAENFAFPQATTPLKFEAATIKPTPPESAGTPGVSSCRGTDDNRPASSIALGRCLFHRQSLRQLLLFAYPSPVIGFLGVDQLVTGGASWIDETYFDGEVKAEDPSTTTTAQLRQMTQTLLKEHFKLTIRQEMRDVSGYFLVVAEGGSKLKEVTGPPPKPTPGAKPFPLPQGTLRQLVLILSQQLKAPVFDKTAIAQGRFDYSSLPSLADADTAGSIFTAVREQLGLKLEAQKIPVEIIVIDHAERPAGLAAAQFGRREWETNRLASIFRLPSTGRA